MDKFVVLDLDDLFTEEFNTKLDTHVLNETRKIVEATNAYIIISATDILTQKMIDGVIRDLRQHHLTLAGIVDRTDNYINRIDALMQWFDDHRSEITCALQDISFVIVDSDLENQTDDVIQIMNQE